MAVAKSEQLSTRDEVLAWIYSLPVGHTFTTRSIAVKYGGRASDRLIQKAVVVAARLGLVAHVRLARKRARGEAIPYVRRPFRLPVTMEALAASRNVPPRLALDLLECLRRSGYVALTKNGYAAVD